MEQIRIFLADDHPLIRAGIVVAMHDAPDMLLVGEAADGYEVLQRCQELLPTVVVLDLHMHGPPPFALVADLRMSCPTVKILILTAYNDDIYVRGALSAGAVGYVLKDEDTEVLMQAIRKVAQGTIWCSPSIVAKLTYWAVGASPLTPPPVLSTRELEILRQVAAGKTNREIGGILGISEKTVEKSVGDLLRKLGATTRVEAAVSAVRLGWI